MLRYSPSALAAKYRREAGENKRKERNQFRVDGSEENEDADDAYVESEQRISAEITNMPRINHLPEYFLPPYKPRLRSLESSRRQVMVGGG